MWVGRLGEWTMSTPFNMFIPQVNAISPVFDGVNSICTGSFRGNARLIFKEGNNTSVPQVLSVLRRNVRRAGLPARRPTFAGSNPCSVTTTLAV